MKDEQMLSGEKQFWANNQSQASERFTYSTLESSLRSFHKFQESFRHGIALSPVCHY